MRNVIHLGGRLLIICLIAGLLLGLVYHVTLPYKEAADAAALQASLEAVCPGGVFEETDGAVFADAGMENVLHMYTYTRGDETGCVAVVQSMGYKGYIPVTVGISAEGEVIGLTIGTHGETPGIGTRIEDPAFTDLFVGLTPPVTGSVDTLTGATYSSGAVIDAVDLARQAMDLVEGA